MPDQTNPNPKPPGMKASLSAEDLAKLQPAPQVGEVAKRDIEKVLETLVPHEPRANETGVDLLNEDDSSFKPFADEVPTLEAHGSRAQFLVEVLHNYRQQLEALIARQEIVPANQYGGASLLNPTPNDSDSGKVISAAERGIAKCNQLMRELGVVEGA